MKKVHTNQKGMALVLVLIVFGVGSLTIVPFWDFRQMWEINPTALNTA